MRERKRGNACLWINENHGRRAEDTRATKRKPNENDMERWLQAAAGTHQFHIDSFAFVKQ